MNKLIRITTVPASLLILLKNQLKFMSDYYEVIAVSSNGKQLEKVGEDSHIRTVGVDMTRKITPLSDLKSLWNLYKTIKNEKPFIVHTHTPKAGLLGMIAAKFANVPIRLHTVAGMPLLETRGIKRKILELAEKVTYACAIKIYPNSVAMKNIIIANKYCSAEKLSVIGNGSSSGIDTNHFDPSLFSEEQRKQLREDLNIAEKDIVFCFIGRIVAAKGIRELVSAFCNINKGNKNTKLLLVGYFEKDLDPLDAATESQISNHDSIILINFQSDVRPYLAISNIFVFPSYREGFPNVVMQAGAMGLACIASDINGCNEIIENDKNGIIVPAKDTMRLQIAMEKLVNDPGLLKKMSSVSRQLIVNRYAQQLVLNEILKEYQLIEESYTAS